MFTTGDIFFLVVFITSPLILLLASRLVTRFPPLMAVLLFFLGPLAGTSMLVAVGEFAKAKPVLSRIPAALPFFYFFYGLPIFGLWVVVVGVVGWCGLRRVASVRQMGAGRKICGSAALGLLIGPPALLTLWAVFSLDPDWPVPDRISNVVTDPVAILSLILQGAVAGLVCGFIVGSYLGRDATPDAQGRLTRT